VTHEEIEEVVAKAVAETLSKLGIEPSDHKELQADFIHLRRWRKSVEQAQSYSLKVVITTLIGGLLGAVWLGIQMKIGAK
jgi:hypothetical protein